MMEDKSDSYATADAAADTAERLKRRMSGDMRFRVRRLVHAEPFTQGWVDQLDPLKYLATVAASEHVTAVREQAQRDGTEPQQLGVADASAAATIWEREEVCIRIIVEEGKINLLMRALAEYKEELYAKGFPGLEFEAYGRLYENSLGQLVKCALYARECLQTLDLRTVIEHVGAVLRYASQPDKGPIPEAVTAQELASQELLVPVYLAQILAQVEKLNADLIVEKVVEAGVIDLCRQHCAKYQAVGPVVAAHLEFLALLFDTESFKTCMGKSVFVGKEDRKAFCAGMDPIVKAHVAAQPEKKRPLRPLSDFIIRYK